MNQPKPFINNSNQTKSFNYFGTDKLLNHCLIGSVWANFGPIANKHDLQHFMHARSFQVTHNIYSWSKDVLVTYLLCKHVVFECRINCKHIFTLCTISFPFVFDMWGLHIKILLDVYYNTIKYFLMKSYWDTWVRWCYMVCFCCSWPMNPKTPLQIQPTFATRVPTIVFPIIVYMSHFI